MSGATEQRQSRIWKVVRQALLMIAAVIEKEYGLTSKAGTKLRNEGLTHLVDDT